MVYDIRRQSVNVKYFDCMFLVSLIIDHENHMRK